MEAVANYLGKFLTSMDKRLRFLGFLTVFTSTVLLLYADFKSIIIIFCKDTKKNKHVI